MDVVHLIHDPSGIEECADCGVFVVLAVYVHEVNGRASRTKVNAVARQFEVVLRVLRMQRQVLVGNGERVLNKCAWKPQTLVVAVGRACSHHGLDTRLRRIGDADVFQGMQSRVVDRLHIAFGKRLVRATLHTWANRTNVFRERGCSQGLPG